MTNKNDHSLEHFFELLANSLENTDGLKLSLSKYRGDEKELQRIIIRPITLRNESVLSFVYEYKTRHITKNLTFEQALILLKELLGKSFKSAYLFTENEEVQCEISKKGKVTLRIKAIKQRLNKSDGHDRAKKRFVDINRPFLTHLGVTDQQQQLIPAMSKKWKQINKFIEVMSKAFEDSPLAKNKSLQNAEPIQVVDFGSGKGYLTFAIHDYLRNRLHNESLVTGVELREELANLCNDTAARLEHKGLSFVCGDVKTHAPKHTDVMIALHACDIATDYAIHYGIRANASIIMCSPCCHKQIRPQMESPLIMKPMLKYGVHMGLEAEMVTDSLRALLLEANGYSTKVFEFISLEHTNKNKMILAVKKKKMGDNKQLLEEIAAIKAFYSIDNHCLESLLLESK